MTVATAHSDEAEESVLGKMLDDPNRIVDVVGSGLMSEHFYRAHNRLLFEAIVEGYYADTAIDPLTIATKLSRQVAASMGTDEARAVQHVRSLAAGQGFEGSPVDHAKLVTEKASARKMLRLAESIQRAVGEGKHTVEQIAGMTSTEAMKVATASSTDAGRIVSLADSGRDFVRTIRQVRAAREAGQEMGAYFGIRAFDDYTHGLQPTELMIVGGEPGVGKSAVIWTAARQFAERQATKPKDKQVAALILSLEMGQHPSNVRLAQAFSGVEGAKLREGTFTDADLQQIVSGWRERLEVPLYFNYAPTVRASQLRAIVTDAITRHNVGLVVIDHFRMFDLDRRLDSVNQEDEEKARFLKEQLAASMNIAVICLAHTRKKDGSSLSDPRPKLSDLRGSGQIAAHSDFTCFIHRPHKYASQSDIDSGRSQKTDAELIWEKNRHGDEGIAKFYFEPAGMKVY